MMNIEKLIEKMIAGGIQVKGDFVMHKEVEYEVAHVEPGDLVLTLGCGDVYKIDKLRRGEKKN